MSVPEGLTPPGAYGDSTVDLMSEASDAMRDRPASERPEDLVEWDAAVPVVHRDRIELVEDVIAAVACAVWRCGVVDLRSAGLNVRIDCRGEPQALR